MRLPVRPAHQLQPSHLIGASVASDDENVMNGIPADIQKLVDGLWLALSNLLSVWTAYQAAIIAMCYLGALGLSSLVGPQLEVRLRRIEHQPRLLRFLAVLLRRLKWVVFAAFLWGCKLVMQQITWPSHSYFVGLTASLATAWVVASVLSRIIRRRSLAQLIAVGAWSAAALYIVGGLDATIQLLDWMAISFGSVRISLLTLLKGVTVLGLMLWTGSITGDLVSRRIEDSDLMSPSLLALASKLARALLIVISATLALSAAGIDVTVLTVFSGALGLGLGFGLQKVASNLASGVIMLADRSVKPGDVIQLGTTFGWITSIRARYVSVVTRDGAEYLIPNEQFITERVVNWSYTDRRIRLEVKFGVAYDSNPHQVRRLVAEAVSRINRVLATPVPLCHLVAFGESSLDFVVRFWIDDPENGVTNIRGEALLAIWDVLKKDGISIPYPHREVILRRPAEGAPGQ